MFSKITQYVVNLFFGKDETEKRPEPFREWASATRNPWPEPPQLPVEKTGLVAVECARKPTTPAELHKHCFQFCAGLVDAHYTYSAPFEVMTLPLVDVIREGENIGSYLITVQRINNQLEV